MKPFFAKLRCAFSEMWEAEEHDKWLPLILYALFRGMIYGTIFGLYSYFDLSWNCWITGLLMTGFITILGVILWRIGVWIKKTKKIKEEKLCHHRRCLQKPLGGSVK